MVPDITIVVGSGERQKTFKCFKSELVFASEHFDAMLSESMRNEKDIPRVEFLEDDPEEWSFVYTFINPKTIRGARITESNIYKLIPWFHKLQMSHLLNECDYIFCNFLIPSGGCDHTFWEEVTTSNSINSDSRRSCLDALLNILTLSNKYSLTRTGEKVVSAISVALKVASSIICFEDIKKLREYLKISPHNSEQLWNELKIYLPDAIVSSTEGSMMKLVESDLFAHIVFSEVTIRGLEIKRKNEMQLMEQERERMKKAMAEVLQFPNLIYQHIPSHKVRGESMDAKARSVMKKIIYISCKDNEWIHVPSNWCRGDD